MVALSTSDTPFSIQLSLSPVIEKLEESMSRLTGDRAAEVQALLQEIAADAPELRTGITKAEEVHRNEELIGRLLSDYFPEALTRNEIKAVSIPFRDIIFNHTERFRNILDAAGPHFQINIRDFEEHQFYVFSCCLILNEFYGTQLDFGRPLFYDIPAANGIIKHYRILYNADYLDILPTEKSVPLTPEDIDLLLNNYDDLKLWKSKFPKESWILKGFALMTLFDATVENAVSLFKEKLLVLNVDGFQQSVESIFQSIFRIPDLQIGFTVYNREEGKFIVAAFGQKMKSFILSGDNQKFDIDVLCGNSYQCLLEEKGYYAVSDTAEFSRTNPKEYLSGHFHGQGFNSFILAPAVKNNVLLGILEIVSPRSKELNSINANKLDVVMPFLIDAIDRLMGDLQNQIQAFIQDKYTAIHSSVSWKFKAEAQRFLYDREVNDEYALAEITFPDLYPLFGQVDIKGSSESRNRSVQNDLKNQVSALLVLLQNLQQYPGMLPWEEEEEQLSNFLDELERPLRASTEQYISNYITNLIHTRLNSLSDADVLPLLTVYYKETEKEKGSFHTYRRKYETTVSRINQKLANILDDEQVSAQAYFPHYYERFKTDGVEHNLYIGPSIAPTLNFDANNLYSLRLWQMRVLCKMEIAHYHLKPTLPYPLDVATLILVYSTPISIRFRMDEKRFDVDGTYNARFEIEKKRLDKAYIRNTTERITAAGKITIVYSSDSEQGEYLRYIKTLQDEQLLDNDIEQLELEDLQGVSGLRALRVGIIHAGG
jgi:hypothetical protein